MSNEAKVKLDVEGGPEAVRWIRDFSKSFDEIGRAAARAQKDTSDKFKAIGSYIGGVAANAIRDFGSLSTSLARVDPSTSAQRFRDFRGTLTEFGISSKRSIDSLRTSFQDLSAKTTLPQEEVASFSRALAKSTFDTRDSSKAVLALAGFAAMTGRSIEEMGGAAEALHNQMGVSFDDMPRVFGKVEAAANKLETVGGPAALMEQIQSLSGSISQLSMKGGKDIDEFVGVMGALGKGLRPEQAKQVQSSLTSIFTQGGEQLRTNMGLKTEEFYDEQGGIKLNKQNISRYRDFLVKRAGGEKEAKRLMAFHDPRLAAALFRTGFKGDLEDAAGAAPTTGAADSLQALRASEHGVETAAANAREARATQEVGSATNTAQQAAAAALPDDPWARFFSMKAGGGLMGLASGAMSTGGAALALKATGLFGGGAAATGGGAGLLASIGLPALAFLGGGAVGMGVGHGLNKLDDKYDISGEQRLSNLKLAAGAWETEKGKVHRDVARYGRASAAFMTGQGDLTQLTAALAKLTDRLDKLNPQVRIVDDSANPTKVIDDRKGQTARQ